MAITVDVMQEMTTPTHVPDLGQPDDPAQIRRIERTITKKSFAVLSTVSDAGFPHAAGVIYEAATRPSRDGGEPRLALYIHTMRHSRKARNIAVEPRVGVVIPVRSLPVGPPFNVQFQGRAELLAMDDPEIVALLDHGRLDSIAGHGALDEPDGCFVRITPGRRIHSYGIGVSALAVARDPLHHGPRMVNL